MIKGLLLSLTLILITATAALIGINMKTNSVMELKHNEPIVSEDVSSSKESPSSSDTDNSSKAPPRFILNEPIDKYLSESQKESLDPSAHVKAFDDSTSEISDSAPIVPDEKDIKKAAEPYILEIMNIKNNAFANIGSLEKKIAVEFLAFPQNERQEAVGKLTDKYMPRITLILSTADDDVNRAIKKMEAAVTAINGDTKICDEALKSYEKEKDEKIKYYQGILSSMGQNIDIPKKEEGSGV